MAGEAAAGDETFGFGICDVLAAGVGIFDVLEAEVAVEAALLPEAGVVASLEVEAPAAGEAAVATRLSFLRSVDALAVLGMAVDAGVDFVGVAEGEAVRTKDLEFAATKLLDGERGMLDPAGDVGIAEEEGEEGEGEDERPESGDRALSDASLRSRLERSKPPPVVLVDAADGLLSAAKARAAEEEEPPARSGEVERLAERDVDLEADLDPMREPAVDAGGVGSNPSISAVSNDISSVKIAFTFASTSCSTNLA